MKITILSDIHDQTDNLARALEQSADSDLLICCGDLCSPFVMQDIGRGFANPIHVVFGNNDGDLFRHTAMAAKFPHITVHGEYFEETFGGLTFAVTHFDNIGRAIAKGGAFDVVCCGHNHQFEISNTGNTLLINPGEIYGGRSGHATFVVFDTATREARRVDL